MIIGCVIAYQEEEMLPGCLESLVGKVDRVVVVDGAYAAFPHPEGVPWSTDATREIAWCYGAEWIGCPEDAGTMPAVQRAWRDQMEKRSAYLVGDEGDWYLRIDADERLVGELPGPVSGERYAMRALWWYPATLQSWVPCLFEHRGRMRYEGAHCALWSDNELVSRLEGCVRWTGGHLAHLTGWRNARRQAEKREYYRWQRAAERTYRRQHNI